MFGAELAHRDGDLCGHADAVSAKNSDRLLYVLFRGFARALQARRSESASDLENHLAVHRQNHAVAIDLEF